MIKCGDPLKSIVFIHLPDTQLSTRCQRNRQQARRCVQHLSDAFHTNHLMQIGSAACARKNVNEQKDHPQMRQSNVKLFAPTKLQDTASATVANAVVSKLQCGRQLLKKNINQHQLIACKCLRRHYATSSSCNTLLALLHLCMCVCGARR